MTIDTTRDLLISLSSHMAYMQGQLEEHHGLDDLEDYYWYRESVALRQKVANALADEPAVPEGREPAAVITEPSDEELLKLMPEQFRQDLATVSSMAAHGAGTGVTPGLFRVILNTGALEYARAVLACWGNCKGSLTSSPPADGEVAELTGKLIEAANGAAAMGWDQHAQRILRAAELLERQALVPVPVSERPWEREGWCDAEGNCWLGGNVFDGSTPTWLYGPTAWAERFPNVHRVLLPTHALPLPEVGE